MSLVRSAHARRLVGGCGGSGGPKLNVVASGGGKQPIKVKAPKSVKAGLTRIVLKNQGKAPSDAQLLRIDGNHSVQEVLRIVGAEGSPVPGWLHAGGGVGQVPPGKTNRVVQNLQPGKYYVVAGIGDQGKPGTAPLTVQNRGKQRPLPKTNATITTREYTFDTAGLKAGKQKVLFRNAGDQLHHVVAAPMVPGKTLADVKKFVRSMGPSGNKRPSGPPPVRMDGGFQTTVLDKGGSQVIFVNLKPGRYAFMCFINDRKGGPPHVLEGMLKEVVVK